MRKSLLARNDKYKRSAIKSGGFDAIQAHSGGYNGVNTVDQHDNDGPAGRTMRGRGGRRVPGSG